MVQINNRSIQDMHILGDPMRVPIIIIERVLNAPRRTLSDNSYLRHVDMLDSGLLNAVNDDGEKTKATSSQKSARELKIVVFVHGFQASILALVASVYHLLDRVFVHIFSTVGASLGLEACPEPVAYDRSEDRVSHVRGK